MAAGRPGRRWQVGCRYSGSRCLQSGALSVRCPGWGAIGVRGVGGSPLPRQSHGRQGQGSGALAAADVVPGAGLAHHHEGHRRDDPGADRCQDRCTVAVQLARARCCRARCCRHPRGRRRQHGHPSTGFDQTPGRPEQRRQGPGPAPASCWCRLALAFSGPTAPIWRRCSPAPSAAVRNERPSRMVSCRARAVAGASGS